MNGRKVLLVASGDLRTSANRVCWPAQHEMEQALTRAVAEAGYELVRAHPYKADAEHGFIGSQKEGMKIFAGIDPKYAAGGGGGGVAVFASRSCRADFARGADFDGGELVGDSGRDWWGC